MNNTLLFILCLFFQMTFGQTTSEKLIHGKLIVDSGTVGGVSVINLVNKKSSVSDNKGEFYILAKEDDLLVFSSINLEYYRKIIEVEDLKPDVLIIKMVSKITELDEVIVNKHPEINAVALGISPEGIKHRTRMERRLYTAGDFKPIDLLGLLGGHLEVDPILNAINGRTAMTKRFIKLENKIDLLEKTDTLFEDEFYVNALKIPSDYIKGFQYYCIEDENFVTVLNAKNKTKIEFCMVSLAEKYNEIIACENE